MKNSQKQLKEQEKSGSIPKTYEPQAVEDALYKQWEDAGIFRPSDPNPHQLPLGRGRVREGEPFSIAMPPPNATGILHIGHATFVTLQDIMARHARMQGKPTLWLPGTDHAAIATESRVDRDTIDATGKTKHDLGRDAFLKKVHTYVKGSQATIKNQIRKMGASCDWSRERYTLDPGLTRCVQEVFIKMYNDGLIYRGHRIVNWDPNMQTTVADDEIEHVETQTPFYRFQYGPFIIGTSRPETKFGDKYVVMHPNDARYAEYKHGQTFECEWINGTITATVIKDEAVDPEFGTGVMTITPWHDATDFGIAERHQLDKEQIIDLRGKLLPIAGEFAGMDIAEARPKIVQILQDKGLLVDIDDEYINKIAASYRGNGIIEPQIMEQWFVNVDKPARTWPTSVPPLARGGTTAGKNDKKLSLKEIALEVVRSGDIEIVPDRFKKTYFHWMENLHDWCISRQIWFGHRIPAWFQPEADQSTGGKKNYKVQIESPGKEWVQDPDTLDTWFSSAMWTFSTLLDAPKDDDTIDSWIKRNKEKGTDLAVFHPTSVLETAYEILFFWVARMIIMTTYVVGEIPFKTVYLHGLVRDKLGRKMSKSLDNGVDPLRMIEKYGTDAVRLSLVIGTTPGNDTRMYEEKIAGYRNFVNKIWNVARFILMDTNNLSLRGSELYSMNDRGNPDAKPNEHGIAASANTPPRNDTSTLYDGILSNQNTTLADQWIVLKLNQLITEVNTHFEKYEFSIAGEKIYDFLWHDLADWYLEIAKTQDANIAPHILLDTIKLLHPFTPFITEEIYQRIKTTGLVETNDAFLAVSTWPLAEALSVQTRPPRADASLTTQEKKIQTDFAVLQSLVTTLRDMRATHNLPYSEALDAAIATKDYKDVLQEHETAIERLTKIRIQVLPTKPTDDACIKSHTAEFDVFIKLGTEKIREQEAKNQKEREQLERYIAGLEQKLSNKQFTQNAPSAVVTVEQEKLKMAQEQLKKL